MDSFSDEIMLLILSRIPTLDLVRLQYVCKRWKYIMKEPLFLLLHLLHSNKSNPMDSQFLVVQHQDGQRPQKLLFQNLTYKARYLQTSLTGHTTLTDDLYRRLRSHNGLLFFCDGPLRSIFIMNPFTNQFMLLPKPDDISFRCDVQACGFAFDPLNNFYKAVIIIAETSHNDYHNHYQLMLFDNCSTEWRSIGWIDYAVRDITTQVLVHRRLHWMADRKIVSFDLANEKLGFIAPPDPLIHTFGLHNLLDHCTLMVIGGYLCVIHHTRSMQTLYLQIWIMREYGVEKSWVKELEMGCILPSEVRETQIYMEAVGEIENGKILLRFYVDWEKGSFAYLCELKSKKCEFIGQKEMPLLSDYWRNRIRSFVHNANIC